MDLLLVSFPKGLVLIELDISLYSNVGLSLSSHILPLKLRTTLILCSTTVFQDFFDLISTAHTSHSQLEGYRSYSKGILVFLQISRKPGALIPIVGIVKPHVQFSIIRLVRYCPLWV